MSRQYFADVLTEPVNASFNTITSTIETALIPTAFTPINALEPRGGKVYELWIGGTCTNTTSGTLIITARYGTAVGCSAIATSATQSYQSVTTGPFLLRAYLIFRSIGINGANSTCIVGGGWQQAGSATTLNSETSVWFQSTGTLAVDTSVASALWIGVTFSVAPTVIPLWHVWRSIN